MLSYSKGESSAYSQDDKFVKFTRIKSPAYRSLHFLLSTHTSWACSQEHLSKLLFFTRVLHNLIDLSTEGLPELHTSYKEW